MKNSRTINRNILLLLTEIAVCASIVAGLYFYLENQTLAYFDANTRLNIARRIFDNLTPGFAQIGNVWQPFPQILMLPLVWFDPLWRTGIAGWIVSGISYVLTAILLYKTIYAVTKKYLLGILGSLTFTFNINVLFLQSTAMSESFFWLTMTANLYYFIRYIQTKQMKMLIFAAVSMFFCTLTRYEGYALLLASALFIISTAAYKKLKREAIEGRLIMYLFPASLGVVIWFLYLWVIFGDPLYWLHYYVDEKELTATSQHFNKLSYFEAFTTYIMAVTNMSGVVTALFGGISLIYVLLRKSIKFELKALLWFPLLLVVFMVFTLSRNTIIDQPFMSLSTLLDKNINLTKEFNLRYGLNILPYLIIFTMIMLDKVKFIVLPYIVLLIVQTVAYFWSPLYLTYNLAISTQYDQSVLPHVSYLQKNYDGGLILVSAHEHDPEMLKIGIPYKAFIHEGTQHYWYESLQHPEKYAHWILYDKNNPDDAVNKKLHKERMKSSFEQVYEKNGVVIYKKVDNKAGK
jgi:hypothetical protein